MTRRLLLGLVPATLAGQFGTRGVYTERDQFNDEMNDAIIALNEILLDTRRGKWDAKKAQKAQDAFTKLFNDPRWITTDKLQKNKKDKKDKKHGGENTESNVTLTPYCISDGKVVNCP